MFWGKKRETRDGRERERDTKHTFGGLMELRAKKNQ